MKNLWIGLLLCLGMELLYAKTLPEWVIIPDKSQLTFTATYNGNNVSGEFKRFSGQILGNPQFYKEGSVHIIIDIESIALEDSDIAAGLIEPEWFDSANFPKADFKATKFNKLGAKTYQADGFLVIKDKPVPVTLIFTAKEFAEKHQVLIEGQTLLKRSAFGLGQEQWANTKEVADEVTVAFKILAVRKNISNN